MLDLNQRPPSTSALGALNLCSAHLSQFPRTRRTIGNNPHFSNRKNEGSFPTLTVRWVKISPLRDNRDVIPFLP